MIWLAKRIGSTAFELVGGSQPSPTIFAEIYQAPADAEHAADLDVITELDEFGESRKRIVINAVKRQARLDAEAQDELERKAAEDAKKTARDAARARIITITDKKPPTMEEMREAMRLLIDQGVL